MVRVRPSSRETVHGVEPTASCKKSLTRVISTPTSDEFHRRSGPSLCPSQVSTQIVKTRGCLSWNCVVDHSLP